MGITCYMWTQVVLKQVLFGYNLLMWTHIVLKQVLFGYNLLHVDTSGTQVGIVWVHSGTCGHK